ncbi:MAG: hypothetical protein PSN46_05355 [Gammaproteobacteria bacterium]|nr:hypothetical protein [Gammaproteobacteria bacterium]
MIKKNLLVISIAFIFTTACSATPKADLQQQQLAADIYAQLALGYMSSGHLGLAEQRLQTAMQLMPNGKLTQQAQAQWQLIQPTTPPTQK